MVQNGFCEIADLVTPEVVQDKDNRQMVQESMDSKVSKTRKITRQSKRINRLSGKKRAERES